MGCFIDIPGDKCDGNNFKNQFAFKTFRALSHYPNYKLIQCKKLETEEAEIIIVDVEVEISQRPVYKIKCFERIAIVFSTTEKLPEILSLRENFPITPHQNINNEIMPRSLCLFDEDYNELKLKLTPLLLLERIFNWLCLTAKGQLHQIDQPLEPLFLPPNSPTLIIPYDIFDENPISKNLLLIRKTVNDKNLVLIAERIFNTIQYENEIKLLAIIYKSIPIMHGIIKKCPSNLFELDGLLNNQIIENLIGEIKKEYQTISDYKNSDHLIEVSEVKFKLQFGNIAAKLDINQIKERKKHIKDMIYSKIKENFFNSWVMIILQIPIKRNIESPPEADEIWSYIIPMKLIDLGISLGIWANTFDDYFVALLLSRDKNCIGDNIPLQICNTMKSYSRSLAINLNNNDVSEKNSFILVGAGALGSQILINCIRMGVGNWSIIDHDIFYPHNLARHALMGFDVGYYKSKNLEIQANEILKNSCKSYVENVFDQSFPSSELKQVFNEVSTIIDISTSIAVERKLAIDIESKARRVSIFLNPIGNDSVFLAEDFERKITLDVLEMQYYRSLIENEKLCNHLINKELTIRYAGSCRDFTSRISQDVVAFHASLCTREIIKLEEKKGAQIRIIKYDKDNIKLEAISIDVYEPIRKKNGDWNIIYDKYFTSKINEHREKKLPYETGGILIGSYDMYRKIIYLVDIIPSPDDSEEWPKSYKRGILGVLQKITDIKEKTANWLEYIGEWHSHPDNVNTRPSVIDKEAFSLLKEELNPLGYPPLMLIVGKGEISIYTDEMD